MDLLILILIIAFLIIYNNEKSNQNSRGDQKELTKEQLRWRDQQEDPFTPNWNGSHNASQSKLIEKQIEELNYIQKNVRPFHFLEWVFWAVPADMFVGYIAVMGTLVVTGLLIPLYFFGSAFTITCAFFIMGYDLWMYWRYRIWDVTIRNPEWWEKFGDIHNIDK